jgi:putative ABC transport system permease protein
MISNYLKIAFRKLAKHRDYAILNVLGLGLSVGCSILIFMLVRHHLSFDNFHKDANRVVRVVMDVKTETILPISGVPAPMAKTLRLECPILEKTSIRMGEDEVLIAVLRPDNIGLDKYKEKNKFAWIDPDYLNILNLPLLQGDATALSEPNTVLLTENMAIKYFGKSAPLGKTIRVDNETDLRIVGILQDLPKNTDYPQEILASWATMMHIPRLSKSVDEWGGARGDGFCLGLLAKGHQVRELDAAMDDFTKRHPHPESAELFRYKAKAMSGLHFDTDYGFGMNKNYLWALGFIGLFLLLTACVNFVNMATAQALTRMREVGVRKSLGSTRGQLFWQFMSETGLIVLAWLALPYLNTWINEDLEIDRPMLATLVVFSSTLGIILTFLAGFYPAFMQARFNPVTSMKSASELPKGSGFSVRRILVTTQFAISQMLIISAAVVTMQMQYAQNADWGFRPGAILTVEIPDAKKAKNLQQQISQIAGVQNTSLCYQPPASDNVNHTGIFYDKRPQPEAWLLNNKPADANYIGTFGLQLVAGRNLYPSDTAREFLVNETFVKKLNLASPQDIINKIIHVNMSEGPIVGVVHDFLSWGISDPVSAIAISSDLSSYSTCAIQLSSGNPTAALTQIQKIWENEFPDNYYEHRFMEDKIASFLETETMILRLVRTFAGIAVFIGCLGLYGLASFMITRKRKEVGIRKALGASILGIVWLFGKEYTRLIAIAFVLSAPVAWFAMNSWLKDYVYRISIGWSVFVVSLLATFLIAALTVGIQSIKAALANPVSSLRSE